MELLMRSRNMRTTLNGAATITTAILLAGCGSLGAGSASSNDLEQQIRPWWGATSDAQAGEVLAANSLNGRVDSCLEARGYPRFDWRASIFPPANDTTPATVYAVLTSDTRSLFADDYVPGRESADVERRLNSPPNRSDAEIAAEDSCLEEARKVDVSDDDLDAMKLPPEVAELRDSWREELARAESEVVAPEKVMSCFDALELTEARGRAGNELATLASEVHREIEAEGLSADEADAKFAAWDSAIVQGIRECSEPYVEAAQESISAAYAKFASEHADEIEQAERAWAAVRRDATSLGWSPDDPLAGYTPARAG